MIIRGAVFLLGAQALGQLIARLFHLPLSDAVIGLVLAFSFFLVRKSVPKDVETLSDGLIHILPLLFVPAAVGIVQYAGVLKHSWLALSTTIVTSAVLTMVITFVVFRFIEHHAMRHSS